MNRSVITSCFLLLLMTPLAWAQAASMAELEWTEYLIDGTGTITVNGYWSDSSGPETGALYLDDGDLRFVLIGPDGPIHNRTIIAGSGFAAEIRFITADTWVVLYDTTGSPQFVRTEDDGLTWSAPVNIATVADFVQGSLHISTSQHYSFYTASPVEWVWTNNGGSTWASRSGCTGLDQVPQLAWTDNNGLTHTVHGTRSGNQLITQISTNNCASMNPLQDSGLRISTGADQDPVEVSDRQVIYDVTQAGSTPATRGIYIWDGVEADGVATKLFGNASIDTIQKSTVSTYGSDFIFQGRNVTDSVTTVYLFFNGVTDQLPVPTVVGLNTRVAPSITDSALMWVYLRDGDIWVSVSNGLPGIEAPVTEVPELTEGVEGIMAGLGFLSAGSKMLFALILIALSLLASALVVSVMGEGTWKNWVLHSISVLTGIFCILLGALETWMFLLAFVLGTVGVKGGRSVVNTLAGFRGRLRRQEEGPDDEEVPAVGTDEGPGDGGPVDDPAPAVEQEGAD